MFRVSVYVRLSTTENKHVYPRKTYIRREFYSLHGILTYAMACSTYTLANACSRGSN
jgi:hypothetical protein